MSKVKLSFNDKELGGFQTQLEGDRTACIALVEEMLRFMKQEVKQ